MNKKLKAVRNKIDVVDSLILRLLDERMKLGLEATKYKKTVSAPKRVKEILARVSNGAKKSKHLTPKFAVKMFKAFISESKRLQKEMTK